MTPTQFFQGLVAATKADFLQAAIPPALTFLTAMKNAPSLATPAGQLYAVAQAGVLQANLVAALPNLVQTEQAQIASSLAAELQALLPPASAAGAPPTAGAPPAAA
jgi:hypothetical protein